MEAKAVSVGIAEKILWLASKPKRVKIAVGGRGSTKSTGVGDIMLGYAAAGQRICATREFQNSIDDSVHESLKSEIDRMGLTGVLIPSAKDIQGPKNGEIFYKGLARNITSLKSLSGVNFLWIEEGESISKNSLKILTPSIRSTATSNVVDIDGDPPEIWITMNRGSSKDAISKKYLARAEASLAKTGYYEDDLMMVVEVNYTDNPWFPPELEQERADDYENLTRTEYDHIWGGTYSDTVDNAIIAPEWFDACVDAHIKLGFEALGQERVSYDPADTGDDKALCYIHGSIVRDVKSTSLGLIDTATDWATSYANDIKPDIFTWDCDGIGMGLKRQVTDAFDGKKVDIEAFRGSEGPDRPLEIYEKSGKKVKNQKTNKETFLNKRAQYYYMLRDRMKRTYQAIEKGQRAFNPDELISFDSTMDQLDELRAELCRIPRKFNNTGRLQLLTKKEMLAMDIDSPNMADAVMMAQRVVEIEKTKAKKINFSGWN